MEVFCLDQVLPFVSSCFGTYTVGWNSCCVWLDIDRLYFRRSLIKDNKYK